MRLVRLLVDPRKKGMAIDDARLADHVREFSRRHPTLLRPFQKTKIAVSADDATLWFVFCFLLIVKGTDPEGPAAEEIVEVADCVPAQRTKLGLEWFPLIDECYEIYGRRWRAPAEGPRSRSEIESATAEVAHLLDTVEAFADGLPGGPASVADLDGLHHLLHDGRMALYEHYRNLDTDRESQGYYLELCLWHVHEFVQQLGNRLGLTRVM